MPRHRLTGDTPLAAGGAVRAQAREGAAAGPTRRAWLLGVAAVPLAGLAAACGEERAFPGDLEVLVVGGGLAGLRALDLLVCAGRKARLITAGDRLGGRILTVREGLRPGLRAEAGAERVSMGDHRLRGLLRELRIETRPYPAFEGSHLLVLKGRRIPFKSASDLPEDLLLGLSEAERAGAPANVHHALVGSSAPVPEGDPRTGLEWLRDLGMTPGGETLVRAFCPLPLERMPAAAFRRIVARELEAPNSETIAGGSDRVIAALEQRLAPHIEREVRVVALEQDHGEVRALDDQGRIHRARGGIACLPAAVLRGLRTDSTALRQRLERLAIEPELKMCFQVSAPSTQDGLTPYVLQDRFPRVLWPLPERTSEGDHVLSSNAVGDEVALAQRLSEDAAATRTYLDSVLPDVARRVTKVLVHDFNRDLLAGGAYTFPTDGRVPAGNVLRDRRWIFAGSDLSERPGWMEGAVRSAEEAVQEVLQ